MCAGSVCVGNTLLGAYTGPFQNLKQIENININPNNENILKDAGNGVKQDSSLVHIS